MTEKLNSYKLKVFDKYLADASGSFEAFLKERNLEGKGAEDEAVIKAKLDLITEGIEIMGLEDFFKNYLSPEDFNQFKSDGF